MIYNKPNEIIRISRTGRQYENTCVGCVNMKHQTYIVDRTEKHQCNVYPAMDNFVRCKDYVSITINTQTTLKTNST